MKVEQISEHIWVLRSWLLLQCRVWAVVEPDGITLVDAGMPFMAKGILAFLDQFPSSEVKQVLLTHGHMDHVGALGQVLARKQVPVYAHRLEIPYMEGRLPYPRRKKAETNVAAGLAQPLPENGQGELIKMGSLQPYFTPGHAPGHVVYYHEQDRVLLAGDLFTSKRGKLHRPMPIFTADMGEAVKSSLILKKLQPLLVEVCHGNPVKQPAEQLEEYVRSTSGKYGTAQNHSHTL